MHRLFRHPITLTVLGLVCLLLGPDWYFFPLTWIGFGLISIPIFRQPSLRRDITLGYLTGFAFWSCRIHSIVPAYGWTMFVKAVGCAAIPWALFTLIVSLTAIKTAHTQYVRRMSLPVLGWIGVIVLFTHSAVDAFPVEFMLYQPLPFLQIAAIPYGMVVLMGVVMLINIAFAVWMQDRSVVALRTIAGSVVMLILIGVGGALRLHSNPMEEGSVPIAIIQTNLPISYEWRIDHGDTIVVDEYRKMAEEAAKQNPAMIFFSQYSFDMFYNNEETLQFFSELADKTGAYIALGTYTDRIKVEGEDKPKNYNIGYVFAPQKGLAGSYRATSNLPFRNINAAFGEEYVPIETPIGQIGIMLCYDDVVRKVARKWDDNGAELFVVLSNPSTFSSLIIHRSQLVQDQLRAIESGKELIRSSTNGVSGVVDRFGRWKVKSQFDEQTILYVNAGEVR